MLAHDVVAEAERPMRATLMTCRGMMDVLLVAGWNDYRLVAFTSSEPLSAVFKYDHAHSGKGVISDNIS